MSDPKTASAKLNDQRGTSTKGGLSTLFRRKKKDDDVDPTLAAVHSSFAEMRKKDWRAATIRGNDAFGLGLAVAANTRGKGAVIDSISFGGPAADAGVLREGDLLVRINDTDCAELLVAEVNRLLLDGLAAGPVEVEVISLDTRDKAETASMRGDDDDVSIRSARMSGFSNPGLAQRQSNDPVGASSIVSPPSRAPVAQTAAAMGYVDLINAPLNQSVISEVHKVKPTFTRMMTFEETAAQNEELRRRGYILPEEVASTNTRKDAAPVMPIPRQGSGASVSSPSAAGTPVPAGQTGSLFASPRADGPSPVAAGHRASLPAHERSPSEVPLPSHTNAGSVPQIALGRLYSEESAGGSASKPSTHPISTAQYFIGPANGEMAATLLQSKEEGAFVLRESLTGKGKYALTVKFGGTFHQISIGQDALGYRIGRAHAFPTITQLVRFYQQNSLDQHFTALKTTLLHPRGSLDFVG